MLSLAQYNRPWGLILLMEENMECRSLPFFLSLLRLWSRELQPKNGLKGQEYDKQAS